MDPGKAANIVELDLRGQACPSTLLQALRRMSRMKDDIAGGAAVLVILTDNRDSTVTVSETAHSLGYGVTVTKEEAHYRLRIEAGD